MTIEMLWHFGQCTLERVLLFNFSPTGCKSFIQWPYFECIRMLRCCISL